MTTVRSSRASRAAAFLIVAAMTVAFNTGVSGHRRDEYLQAAQIAIEPDRIHVELDLTPGIAIADAVIPGIDVDQDGVVSIGEQQMYTRRVLGAIQLRIDSEPLQMRLVAAHFPDLEAVRTGAGTIAVASEVVVPPLTAGRHRLFFRNTNDPDSSVYLANALVSASDRVSISRQTRDELQRELVIDFSVAGAQALSPRESVFVSLASVAILLLPLARRARAKRHPSRCSTNSPAGPAGEVVGKSWSS
jgi:hypothetical protein